MPTPTLQLAGRGMRFLAKMIDSVIYAVPAFFVLPGFFLMMNQVMALQTAGLTEEELAQQTGMLMAQSGMMFNFLLALLAWLVIAIIQIVLLTKNGQTIGKKLLHIKIVMFDTGLNGGFVPNVLLRSFVNGLLSAIPFYKLIDVLFIFRQDRRCVHDMIAHTTVVQA